MTKHHAVSKIFIVTPTYMAGGTINETIRSVVTQSFDGIIYYHIQDGGSNDETEDIVSKWQRLIDANSDFFQAEKIVLTYTSEPDSGMYDAIHKGIASFDGIASSEDWMTWINADDHLSQSAFSIISRISSKYPAIKWIGGDCSISVQGVPSHQETRVHSARIIREGLADGIHYDFVQQEGTFFKKVLWDQCGGKDAFGGLRLAGDWNLWRMFAWREDYYQLDKTLGYFCIRDGQLSSINRDKYMNEIDSKVPEIKRRDLVAKLADTKQTQCIIRFDWQTGEPSWTKNDFTPKFKILESRKSYSKSEEHQPLDFNSSKHDSNSDKYCSELIGGIPKGPYCNENVWILNQFWQTPAVTERRAAELVSEVLNGYLNVGYIGFPWATLFDCLNSGKEQSGLLLEALDSAKIYFQDKRLRLMTVCQHIHLLRYIELLEDFGVTDIFWSHATCGIVNSKIKVHSFPLYSVNYSSANKPAENRPYRANFMGAKADGWYLTNTRNLILEKLADQPDWIIRGNDEWFFNREVYEKQVNAKSTASHPNEVELTKRDYYIHLLENSVFTLCPSGSGPNSIRLWEAIGSGSIPIIQSDSWRPPGDISRWYRACVFLPDTPQGVLMIPEVVNALFQNYSRLAEMRHHLRELWMVYGPDTFITDILTTAQRYEQTIHSLRTGMSLVQPPPCPMPSLENATIGST